MSILLVIGILILTVSFGLYLHFAPKKLKERIRFESIIVALLIAGITTISWLNYIQMKNGLDSAWWPIAAYVSNLAFIPLFLGISWICRWLAFSKNKSN